MFHPAQATDQIKMGFQRNNSNGNLPPETEFPAAFSAEKNIYFRRKKRNFRRKLEMVPAAARLARVGEGWTPVLWNVCISESNSQILHPPPWCWVHDLKISPITSGFISNHLTIYLQASAMRHHLWNPLPFVWYLPFIFFLFRLIPVLGIESVLVLCSPGYRGRVLTFLWEDIIFRFLHPLATSSLFRLLFVSMIISSSSSSIIRSGTAAVHYTSSLSAPGSPNKHEI